MSQPSSLFSWLFVALEWLGVSFTPSHKPRFASIVALGLLRYRRRIVQLPIGDNVPLQLNVFDAQGDVLSSVTPPPVWASSDPTIATVAAAADGFSAICTAVKVGSVVITCQVTPKVSATIAVDVVAGIPASATITAGTPVPIPGVPPPPPPPTP